MIIIFNFPDQETYIQIWFRYIKQLSENNDIHNIESNGSL